MENTIPPQAKAPSSAPWWRRIFIRLLMVIAVAACVGILSRHVMASLERRGAPAGFLQGMIQGAIMPATLPTLLVGRDVVIYAQANTGVPYKLGYTVGVNACGALFFGLMFWRVNRWRSGREA